MNPSRLFIAAQRAVLSLAVTLAFGFTAGCSRSSETEEPGRTSDTFSVASENAPTPSAPVAAQTPNPPHRSVAALVSEAEYDLRRIAADYDRRIATAPSPQQRATLVQMRATVLRATREKWERRIAAAQ